MPSIVRGSALLHHICRHFSTKIINNQIAMPSLAIIQTNTFNFAHFKIQLPHLQNTVQSLRLFNQITPQKCWHCGKCVTGRDFDDVSCEHCHRIQPLPSAIDYFTYLGISSPQFGLDETDLKRRFRRKQAKVHPDKFAQSNSEERHHSEQHSTFLNNAYRTLRDPFSRADYMLELYEKKEQDQSPSASQTSSAAKPEEPSPADNELAEEMMALNEHIEELEDRQQIAEKMAQVDGELQRLLGHLGEELGRRDVLEGRSTMRRIGYFRRSRRLLEEKMREIQQ